MKLLMLYVAVEMLRLRFWTIVAVAAFFGWLSGYDVRGAR